MVKKGYKQTEVGVVPEDWKILKIKDIGYLTSGESPSHFEFSTGHLPYFKVEQLNNSVKYQIDTPYHTSSSKPIDMGSIIFPKRGAAISTNKFRLLAQPSLLDTNIMALTVTNEQVHNEYLFYWFIRKGLWQIADTTSVPQINNKHILPLQFPLPPFAEQERIADALSDIDSFLTALEKQISKEKAIKQGAMQELLTGKRRLPGFAGEWKICRLDEIADFPTATISTDQFDNRFYVGTDNMIAYKGDVKYNELPLIYPKVRQYQTEDIILSNIRPYLQKIWYATRNGGCSNDVLVIRKKDGHAVEPKFLYYQLSRDGFYDEIMANAVGTKMPRGDKAIVKSYRINMPSDTAEQKAIASILSDADAEIKAMEEKLAKYRQIKQGMMQQLLTGKIRLV